MRAAVEAYALDRDDLDLYGTHVAVDFAARLRSTEKFAAVDDLVEQMRRDADQAREITVSGAIERIATEGRDTVECCR